MSLGIAFGEVITLPRPDPRWLTPGKDTRSLDGLNQAKHEQILETLSRYVTE